MNINDYGAMGERNSIFYNYNCAASVTFTGVQIITTAICAFEAFLSNNIEFKSINEVFVYINNIINEEYEYSLMELIDTDKLVDNQMLKEYLKEKLLDYNNIELLENLIDNLSIEECTKIYYKNNFIKFLDNSDIKGILAEVLSYDFPNAEKPPEEIKENLELLWSLCNEFVVYNYIPENRYERALTMTRKSVIVTDTDSTFLYLDPLYKWIINTFEIEVQSPNDELSIINVLIYLLGLLIQQSFDKLTSAINIDKDHQSIINAKNEFLYSRIMTTYNKKQYAGNITSVEGRLIHGGKLDTKGMSIKKVTVNKYVRQYFTEILEDDILKSENIDISIILEKFKNLEDIIRNDILEGNLTFSIPANINEVESYKFPERMPAVRGSLIWNKLNPNKLINPPEKVNLMKLKCERLDQLKSIYNTDEFNIIKKTIFDDEKYKDYGFQIISIPKDVPKIPKWLIEFVDIDTIINDNIRNGLIILESLGIKTLEILQDKYYSNVIEF